MSIVDISHKATRAIIWQEGTEEESGIGEAAIVIKQYENGCHLVELKQGRNEILINASSLRPLARKLYELARIAELEK